MISVSSGDVMVDPTSRRSIMDLDDLGGSQLLDPRLVVAEYVTEDLIGVLAGHRDRPDLAGSLGHLDRHPRQVDFAGYRILAS